jgi:hypothetical protein
MSIWQSGTFYIGETWVISGYVRDSNGVIVDLTGTTIQLRITLGNSVIFDLTTPTDGEILLPGAYQFEITPDQQTDLALTTYQYEVRATLADGTVTVQNVGDYLIPSKFVNFPAPTQQLRRAKIHRSPEQRLGLGQISTSMRPIGPQCLRRLRMPTAAPDRKGRADFVSS